MLVLLTLYCGPDLSKTSQKTEQIEIKEIHFNELTDCENKVLNYLLKKDVERLIPFFSEEFDYIDPQGISISKAELIKVLRLKKGFWYNLLITAKQPHEFRVTNAPDLGLPEFSVSDMLKRGNISIDLSNPQKEYKNVVTTYNIHPENTNGYTYSIRFLTEKSTDCEFYGVGTF
ncbi:hypothetical protein EHS11_02885 [Leptospira ilyithenensis]|uniref:Uncharacterized protein n=2 Tax=Leptospira ilyithenensis TaxID=2484901 RepID=A0A4R9LS17_9LEPT|nr:hypothetical protein EHS11_02885 [Leptospira ilyithenensis]